MQAMWKKKYPQLPTPFLTATYRGPVDQDEAYKSGRSRAKFGESLHNYKPAYAFDIAFLGADGYADWSFHLFEKMAEFGDAVGLEWGGRWPYLVDGPHFQLPVTVSMIKQKIEPHLKPIPSLASKPPMPTDGWLVVVMNGGKQVATMSIGDADDVVVRYSPTKKRIYLDAKKEES